MGVTGHCQSGSYIGALSEGVINILSEVVLSMGVGSPSDSGQHSIAVDRC